MMKILLVFAIVTALSVIFVAAASADAPQNRAKQNLEMSTGQTLQATANIPETRPADKYQAVMTQSEADSLRVQGDSLMAQAGVSEVPVGALSTTDLIYVLVVVLLVVLILRVAAG